MEVEWRFTMHAYPFYLLASAYTVSWIAERLWLSRHGIAGLPAGWWRSRKVIVGMCAAAACVAVYFAYQALPYFVARESLRLQARERRLRPANATTSSFPEGGPPRNRMA